MSRVHETSRSVGNFPWLPDRPSSSEFPNRWATLPRIASGSPVPGDTQITPYKGGDRPMSGRLAVAEKSNRALLDEVSRLQAESKNQTRRMEQILHEEQGYRKQLENSLRASNDLIAQLSNRLQRAEEKIRDEHSTLTALVSQTKGMESVLMGSQKEMINRKDVQMTRMQELRNQLDESLRAKDQLERTTYQLADELRQLKAKVETQAMDFSQVTNELKNSTRRLEEEGRQTVSSMMKSGENNNTAYVVTHQLRAQLESRLTELRDVLVELRKKQEVETQERRALEQRMQLRLGEVNFSVTEQVRKRDEAMYALEQLNREKGHMSEAEKMRLQAKISETNDEIQRKISQRELKIKEDVQRSISSVEKLLQQEQEDRMKFERSIRNELEERFDALQKLAEEAQHGQQESAKYDKKKQNETLHKLNDGLKVLEKEIVEYRKRQENILAAEVSSRKQHEVNTKHEIRALQEKVNVATAAMQQAISGITLQMASQKEAIRDELKGVMEDGAGSNTRNLADMDARLLTVSQRLTQAEEMLEAKIQAVSEDKEASTVQTQNVREKVESIVIWQDVTSNTLRELEHKNSKANQELEVLKDRYDLLKAELESKINNEVEVKIANIRPRSAPRSGGDPGMRPEELENLQKGIRKLAESIQTVKTVLGMKIQSEQKSRVEGIKSLQENVARLRLEVEPLLTLWPEPMVYVKPEDYKSMDNKVVEEEAPEVNKWNFYNTYRWMMIKEGILKLKKANKDEGKKDDDDKKKKDDDDDDDSKKEKKDDDDNKKKKDDGDDDDDDDKKKKKKDDDNDDDDDDKKKKKKDDDDDDDNDDKKKKKKDDDDDDDDDGKKKK